MLALRAGPENAWSGNKTVSAMEYPSSKRRKTSPTTRTDIDASQSPGPNSQIIHQDASRSRATFMSPTKASLARFNPNLLPRAGSADPPRSSLLSRKGNRKAQTEDPEPENARRRGLNSDLQKFGAANGQVLSNGDLSSSVYEETPSKLPPRNTVTRGTEADQEQQLHLRTPTHNRAQSAVNGKGNEQEDEPSLPSTPSQMGLEPPAEKPRGLLFQSPGRRRARPNRTQTKDSPLKKDNRSEPRVIVTQPRLIERLGPRVTPDTLLEDERAGRPLAHSDPPLLRARMERRIETLQSELTRLSLSAAGSRGEKDSSRKQTRLKRQLAQDVRALTRLPVQNTSEPGASRYFNTVPTRTSLTSSTVQWSAFSRSVYLSPFIRKSIFPTAGLTSVSNEPTVAAGATSRGLRVEIKRSELAKAKKDALDLEQDLELYANDTETLFQLRIVIDPLSQIVSSVSTDHVAAWATQDLLPWLLQEDARRSLQTMGSILRQYLDLVDIRTRCWSHCQETLPDIFASSSLNEPSIKLVKMSLKLTIWWRLMIGDEDEVQSDVSLKPELPAQWLELDSNDDLGRISEVFDGLIRQKGVSEAIRIMSRILFPP